MFKKISTKILLVHWLFLGVAFGGSILLYSIFLPAYYGHYKDKQIMEAYKDIGELDLSDLEEDHYVLFSDYEKENLIFTIADENMQSAYTTRTPGGSAIHRDIEMRIDDFSREPKVIERESKLTESIKLLGILRQNGTDYYVCIKDKVWNIYASFTITQRFLVTMFLITLLVGSILMFLLSRYIVRPIEEVSAIAGKVANKDFSQIAVQNGEYLEINQLAESINSMSEQLKNGYAQIERNQKRFLTQNVREERMEKSRKEFVANISHELKTPLMVISSQFEMLQHTKSEADQKYYCESIQEEISKMSDMIGGLLDVTVMEHHMESMEKKSLNMKDVVEYMIMKYSGIFKKKQIELEVILDEECVVLGDRDYIEQALGNYIMNAFQHTDIGGKIRITMKRREKSVWIGVYNEGEQISEREREDIWQSFYMGGSDHKSLENYSNVGLGLYLVKSVIEMHHGEYGMENIENGVEFWFTLA